jgi:hypothetical protein
MKTTRPTGVAMSAETRERLLQAAEANDARSSFEQLVRSLLSSGISSDKLGVELDQSRPLLSPALEEEVLCLMDRLVGWCAPHARLVAPEAAP